MLKKFIYAAMVMAAVASGLGTAPASADEWSQGWAGAQFSSGSGTSAGKARTVRGKQRASREAYADDSGSRPAPRGRKARAKSTGTDEAAARPARRGRPAKAASGDDDTPRPSRRTARPSSGGGGQTGIASFYWQPQRLATGGWFNPNAMTAAHRSLPFWTRVRVTHLGNGRSVEVVINDRGPYIGGRIIDLSRAAAGVIGMQGQGLAQVRVEVLGR